MAQEGYDDLMKLTDSRYRLSMIVARRAAQLKSGFPTTLSEDELPGNQNTVTIAMRELRSGRSIRWGDELPTGNELREARAQARRKERGDEPL